LNNIGFVTGIGFVQGDWKWHYRSHASSYSPSILLWRYLVSPAIYSDLLVENRGIFIPHLYLSPPQGVTRRNFVKVVDADKTRMIGLPYGEKNDDNILSRFHLIPVGLRTY